MGAYFVALADVQSELEWMKGANCRGLPAAVFYPESHKESRTAKRICAGCPVRQLCLEYALLNREANGVWGGLNERERKDLHAARRRKLREVA